MEKLAYLEDWVAWSATPSAAFHSATGTLAELPVKALPPLLKRRLSKLGGACCALLDHLIPEADLPVVHASRHGDLRTSLALLSDIKTNGQPSPGKFSVSVHNAILGVYSIASGNRSTMQALAACGNEFEAAIIDALGYLHEGYPAVVVLFSEEAIPALLADQISEPTQPCALALRLSLTQGQPLYRTPADSTATPDPLAVLDWLQHPDTSLPLAGHRLMLDAL